MIKKIFAFFLAIVLICPAITFVNAEEEKPIKVRLNVYTKYSGSEKMDGVYKDNTLYVNADVLSEISNNTVRKDTISEVVLGFASGFREMKITSEGRATEKLHKLQFSFDIPVMEFEGKLYFSLPHVLRYQGATLEFGEDENSPTHLMVSEPYTIYEFVSEYKLNYGLKFSWSEAEGKLVDLDNKTLRYLSTLDAVFFGYDSNIFHYFTGPDKIESDFHEGTITGVMKSMTTDTGKDEEKISKIFHNGASSMAVTMDFINEIFSGLDPSLYAFSDGLLMGGSTFLKLTDKLVSVYEAEMLYARLDEAMGKTLKNSLCRADTSLPAYKGMELFFETADSVSNCILDDGALYNKLTGDAIYEMIMLTGDTIMSIHGGYVAAIYDSVALAMSNDEFIQDEIRIAHAEAGNDLTIIANEMFESDYKQVFNNHWYGGKGVTGEYVEYLKADALISLASSYKSRSLLLETGWLSDEAQVAMQAKADKTRDLVAKGIKAENIIMAFKPVVDENIEWIQYLKIGGLDFGNFNDVGNDPNNLWHSQDCLAFDEDYIYYNGGRISYDGKKDSVVAPKGKMLNCYEGYVYYAEDGSGSNPYARIKRMDCSSGVEETIFEITGAKWRNDYEVESLYVTGGYVFFCVGDDEHKNAKTFIYALDLETMQYRNIYSERNELGIRPASFTSDNMRNVYAFMKIDGSSSVERKTLKINIDELKSNPGAKMIEDEGEPQIKSGAFAHVILAPNGLLKMKDKYYEDYFGAVESDGSDTYDEVDESGIGKSVVEARNQRFVLDGSNMVFFVSDYVYADSDVVGDAEVSVPVYICKDFDFNNPILVDRVKNINFFTNGDNMIGVYNNCVYVIEKTQTEFNLVTIEADGTFNRTPIS